MAVLLKDIMETWEDPLMRGLTDHFLNGSKSVVLPELYFVEEQATLLALDYASRDSLGAVGGRNINADYTPGEAKTSMKRETLGLFGGSAELDVVIYRAKPDELDAQMEAKTIASGKYFDKQYINGDSSQDETQFNGLRRRSVLRNRVMWAGVDGAALTLDMLDEALDAVPGDNSSKRIRCNSWMRRKISSLMKGGAGGKQVKDTAFQATEYQGCPIRVMDEDEKYQPIFTFTETRGASNVTSSLYIDRLGGATDRQGIQGIRGNIWMMVQPIARLGSKMQQQMDTVAGICDFEPNCFIRLGGITKA